LLSFYLPLNNFRGDNYPDIGGQLELDGSSEGDKVKALDTAVKNLVNFIEKGGIVDFIVPEEVETEEGEEDKNSELRVAFQEIRQLEKKLELIEHKNP